MLAMHLFSMLTFEWKHLTIPLILVSLGCCCHVVSGDVGTIALLSWARIDQGGISRTELGTLWGLLTLTGHEAPGVSSCWCQPPASVLTGQWRDVTRSWGLHIPTLHRPGGVTLQQMNNLFICIKHSSTRNKFQFNGFNNDNKSCVHNSSESIRLGVTILVG